MEYVIVYIVVGIIGLAIIYGIILTAVRAALFDHYKVVRWFELTGEWIPEQRNWKQKPRDPERQPPKPKK